MVSNIQSGMVLRFYPEGFFVFPDYDIHKQYLIMQKLAGHEIKVPNVLWYEPSNDIFGTSFYVMEMARGDAPSDNPPFHQEGWVADASEEVRERFGGVGLSKWLKFIKLIFLMETLNFLIDQSSQRITLIKN